uniref:Protein MIX23 n=1 Tax=Plectus sambesii TaxID=2011161 RepID=A0A914VUF9_9BILA
MTSASVPIPDISHIPCGDFLAFQEILKRMRTVDDKIIYEMNMTIPTSSFAKGVDFTVQCNQLHHRLEGRELCRWKAFRNDLYSCFAHMTTVMERLKSACRLCNSEWTTFEDSGNCSPTTSI